jgi:3-oxoacyl-[acyl-carrier protein] reductase
MPRLSRLSRSIEGKVALITGAASGMGRATAHLFADEGARVAVTDLQASPVETVVKEITDAGGSATGWLLNVRDADRTKTIVEEVVAKFGGLDVLVNNAGVSMPLPFEAQGFEANWEAVLDVNLASHARLIRAALPHLKRSGEGRIVNIASTEALGGQRALAAYTASKHGVQGLTRALAVELADRGVTVNCICPGAINTGMTAPIPEESKGKFARRRIPLRRYGEPEEVAHATLSLVLPAASYINGATLVVDGGFTIQNC